MSMGTAPHLGLGLLGGSWLAAGRRSFLQLCLLCGLVLHTLSSDPGLGDANRPQSRSWRACEDQGPRAGPWQGRPGSPGAPTGADGAAAQPGKAEGRARSPYSLWLPPRAQPLPSGVTSGRRVVSLSLRPPTCEMAPMPTPRGAAGI